VRKCVDVHEHSAEEFHAEQAERLGDQAAVAYTRPLFGST
jgi:AhpD family alkylhydroperoxidase